MILCLCEFIGRLLNLRIFSKEQMQKAITRALCVCLSVGESTPVLRSVIYSNHLPSFLLWCSALSNAPPWIFIFSLQFIIWRNGEVPEVNVFRSTRVTLLFARWSTCVAKGKSNVLKYFLHDKLVDVGLICFCMNYNFERHKMCLDHLPFFSLIFILKSNKSRQLQHTIFTKHITRPLPGKTQAVYKNIQWAWTRKWINKSLCWCVFLTWVNNRDTWNHWLLPSPPKVKEVMFSPLSVRLSVFLTVHLRIIMRILESTPVRPIFWSCLPKEQCGQSLLKGTKKQ